MNHTLAHYDTGGWEPSTASTGEVQRIWREWPLLGGIGGKAESNYTSHLDLILTRSNNSATAASYPLNAASITEPQGCFDDLIFMKS